MSKLVPTSVFLVLVAIAVYFVLHDVRGVSLFENFLFFIDGSGEHFNLFQNRYLQGNFAPVVNNLRLLLNINILQNNYFNLV